MNSQMRTGALTILATCYLASATLRAGEVVAELPSIRNLRDEDSRLYWEREDPELLKQSAVLREINRKEAELNERAKAVEARSAALADIEARMKERLKELEEARDKLAAETARARDAAEDDVAHLAEMYEAMKPKLAGSLFNKMDPIFAAGFLSRMSPEAGAALIGFMEPERAYAVSVILASRNLRVAEPEGEPEQQSSRTTNP